MKNSLEIIIKQVRLEGGFKRGGRIRVAESLRQIVPDRWASIRKRSLGRYQGESDIRANTPRNNKNKNGGCVNLSTTLYICH